MDTGRSGAKGMTKQEVLHLAMRQSAADCGCSVRDFEAQGPVVVLSGKHGDVRADLEPPFDCRMVSYGNNVVACVRQELREPVRRYLHRFEAAHCFEPPNLHVLEHTLRQHGLAVCFVGEYFLPDPSRLEALACSDELRLLLPPDFSGLYGDARWGNALCETRRQMDMLAVGAYREDVLVGLAGVSADGATLWQIGVDVLPAFRRQGIAAALTARLAREILSLGKLPFYGAAWSNLPSVRNALRCGFFPAWVELTGGPVEFVNACNGQRRPAGCGG